MNRNGWNGTLKSFLIILRIVFVLSSFLFVKAIFFKWDGYSYYMRFIDFLPALSLSFILWTIPGVIFAFALWLITYIFLKISLRSRISVLFEHIIIWIIWLLDIVFIRIIFFQHISLSDLLGLSDFTILIIVGVLIAAIVWSTHKYTGRILDEVNTRITPVVWLFVFLLVLSVPFSIVNIFKEEPPAAEYFTEGSASSYEKHPNIILIIWDTLTTLDMQVYGYYRPTTPFLSEWSKDAFLFKRAYSASNWTAPSVMSLMTGQRVWTHKVWYDVKIFPVKEYTKNLPKTLRDNGYNIYSFIQNSYAHPDKFGIGENFLVKDPTATFDSTFSHNKGIMNSFTYFLSKRHAVREILWEYPTSIRGNIRKLLQLGKSLLNRKPLKNSNNTTETTQSPEMVYNRFLNYTAIQKQKANEVNSGKPFKEPFFVWLHTLPPHHPYLPSKPYMGMFGDAGKFDTKEKQDEGGFFLREYSPEEQEDIDILRKRYDEFILYSDQRIKEFLLRLAETIDLSRTIIIFTSDHGESFTHGFQGHGGSHLYESLLHVPLIIKVPEKTGGKAIDIPVDQIDIAPTILDLAGIPVPAWMEGKSLLSLIHGVNVEQQPIFSMQLIKNRSFGHPITKGAIAVWKSDYKLIYYLGENKSLLFNLGSDPHETQNIFEEEPEIAESLFKLIEDNLSNVNKRMTQSNN